MSFAKKSEKSVFGPDTDNEKYFSDSFKKRRKKKDFEKLQSIKHLALHDYFKSRNSITLFILETKAINGSTRKVFNILYIK